MTDAPFDFRSPPAGEAESIVSGWMTRACKLAPRRWSELGAFSAELLLEPIRTAPPAELIRRLPISSLGFTLEVRGDAAGAAFLTIDRPLLLAIVAGLLGDPVTTLPADRDLTPLEQSMVDVVIQQLLDPLRAAWLGPDPPRLIVTATGAPRKTCRLPADDPALAVTLSLKGPFGAGPILLILPMAGWTDGVDMMDRPISGPFPRTKVDSVVRELPLDFSVILGRARLTIRELAGLKAGDILLLEQRITEPLRAQIGGSDRFQVWPGAIGPAQAVRIHSAGQPVKP